MYSHREVIRVAKESQCREPVDLPSCGHTMTETGFDSRDIFKEMYHIEVEE